VRPLKNAVAGNVISLLLDIVSNASQHIPIIDTDGLEESGQIVHTEMTVWAAMCLASSRWMLCQDLLAGKWGISTSTPIGISAYVAIGVPDVVSILLIERVVRD
jgi:hypothetical protein